MPYPSFRAESHVAAALGLGLFLLLPLALCGCRVGERKAPSTRPAGCAECHIDITCQWEASPHATAWTSLTFQEMAADKTECLPCHAPEPLLEQAPTEELRLRAEHRRDGVDCQTCHAACGKYAGPYRTFGPHGMQQDLLRLPCSSFCGRCHFTEFEEYESLYLQAVDPECAQGCADCHMPVYFDRLTQGHLLSYIHPKRAVRDHSFPLWTETITGGAVEVAELSARRLPAGRLLIEAVLINRGAGHCIPTGKFGHNELRLLAEALDGNGQVVGQSEESVYAGSDSALAPERPNSFALTVPLDDDAWPLEVQLTVEAVNEDRSFRHAFIVRQVTIGE